MSAAPAGLGRLFRSAGVYTGANLLTALVPLALMPILTRALGPEEYGVLAMFQVLVGLVAPFVGMSVYGAVQRRFFDETPADLPAYITGTLIILASSGIAVLLLLYLFGGAIERLAAFPREWLWAVVLVSAAQFLVMLRLIVWQVRDRPVAYGGLQLFRTLLVLLVSVWLVVRLGFGWDGAVLGQVVGVGLAALAAMALLGRDGWIGSAPSRAQMLNALAFGVPLIPHTFARFAMIATDRIFVANMEGLAETGIYMVATQVSMGLMLLFTAFNTAYTPWLYGKLRENRDEVRRSLVRLTWLYMPIALALALALAVLAPPLLEVFVGEEYESAAGLVLWLALGAAFNGMYLMVTNYIFFAERTGMVTVATFVAAGLNIPLTWIMVEWNGATGAAQATMLTLLAKFLFTWVMSARAYPMPWFGGKRA